MFLKDVRKLFHKDVEDDRKPSLFVISESNDIDTTLPFQGSEELKSRLKFDPQKRIICRVDANGHTTRFEYGGLCTPTRITFADSTSFNFQYNDAGPLAKFTADGTLVAMYHKSPTSGRWRMDYADGSDAEYVFENGRLIRASNPAGTVELKYNDKGRIIAETFQGRTVTYRRKRSGHLTGLTSPFDKTIHYKRDRKNRVCRIRDWSGRDTSIHYDDSGAMCSIIYPNGTRLVQQTAPNGLPTDLRLATLLDDKTIFHKIYERDQLCRIIKISNTDNETTYAYDERGRLTGSNSNRQNSIEEVFNVDAMGNRLSDHHRQYRINSADRIAEAGTTKFQYDGLGNLLIGTCPRGKARYTYAGLNCLKSVANESGRAQYRYDALGRRVAKIVNGETTLYIWAGSQLLHEVRKGNHPGGKPTGTTDFLFIPDTHALLAIQQDQQIHWAAFGHRYEVLCLTAEGGRPVWQAEYDSFGSADIDKDPDIFQPFRLAGHYEDDESGLHYIPNRYYDPQIGRYLSLDPRFLESGSENFYVYGNGDPINVIDNGKKIKFSSGLIVPQVRNSMTDQAETLLLKPTEPEINSFVVAQAALLGNTLNSLANELDMEETTAPVAAKSKTESTVTKSTTATQKSSAVQKTTDRKNTAAKLKGATKKTKVPNKISIKDLLFKKFEPTQPASEQIAKPKTESKSQAPLPEKRSGSKNNTPKPDMKEASPAVIVKSKKKPAPSVKKIGPKKTAVIQKTIAKKSNTTKPEGTEKRTKTPKKIISKNPAYKKLNPAKPAPEQMAARKTGAHLSPARQKINCRPVSTPHTRMVCGQINAFTGEVILSRTDFTVSGRIPLIWRCHYQSRNTYVGLFGKGWQSPADARLDIDNEKLIRFFDGGLTDVQFYGLPTTNAKPILNMSNGARLIATKEHYHVRLKSGLTYHFLKSRSRSQLHIARLSDAHDNFIVFDREDNELKRIRDSSEQCIFVRCADGRIISMSLHDAPLVTYQYKNDRLTAAVDSLGHQKSYYYSDGLIVRHMNKNKHSFYYKYGESGRCTRVWDDSGYNEYQFEYRPDEESMEVTNSLGQRKIYAYDEYLGVFKEEDQSGAVIIHGYDEMDRLIAFTDPLGRSTIYEYGTADNTINIQRADGSSISLTHDENNHPVEIIDAEGKRRQQRYDEKGRLFEQNSPTDERILYRYNHMGDLVLVTDRNDTSEFTYDDNGRVISIVHGNNHPTHIQRDITGNPTAVIHPDGLASRYIHDRKNRLIQMIQPSGISQSFDWDPEDNLLTHTDPNGRQTRFEYNGGGAIVRRINADGTNVSYKYDTEDNIVRIINERGQRHHYMYDHAGRIVAQTDYYGHSGRYTYDHAGQLTRSLDPLGRAVTYTYHPAGNLSTRTMETEKPSRFKWDRNGNLITFKSPHTSVERTYDDAGRIISENKGSFPIAYRYDKNGRLSQRTVRGGIRVGYSYDATGAVSAVRINDTPPVTITRNDRGQITSERFSDQLHRSFSYDLDGLLTRQTINMDSREIERRYSYDGAANLIAKQDSHKGDWRYSYDAMDRIIETWEPGRPALNLTYDPCGDIAEHLPEIKDGLRCARYDGTRYYYDAAGNLVRRIDNQHQTDFEWNALNQLEAVKKGSSQKIKMTYDALGRLHQKNVNGKSIFYHWDDNTLVLEQHENGSTMEYVYYPGMLLPLAAVDDTGQVYYYHNDINGLPREVTLANGEIVWSAEYDALGRVKEIFVEKIPQPLRLPGHHFDELIGLCYDGQSYFDPMTCSYLTKQPLRPLGNENLYAYAPSIWTQIENMGFSKAHLRKKSLRKHHSDFREACVMRTPRLSRGYHISEDRVKAILAFYSLEGAVNPPPFRPGSHPAGMNPLIRSFNGHVNR